MAQDPSDERQSKWDNRYSALSTATTIPEPARVLADYHYLLPSQGRALDLACGLAGNAFFMAQLGLDVSAWDSSDVAIQQVAAIAKQQHISLQLHCRDVELEPPPNNAFDVIVVSRFLSRPLHSAIKAALRPNGLLFYQTFIADKEKHIGPSNPDYLLQKNELLHEYADLRVLVYTEQGMVGDVEKGIRNEVLLVARKEDISLPV